MYIFKKYGIYHVFKTANGQQCRMLQISQDEKLKGSIED